MKKFILVIIILFLPAAFPNLARQEQEQVPVQESVKIVNVEVPVRVFYKGDPVDNLTRDDFKLYEDGKLQVINGFNIKRHKIKYQAIDLQVEEQKKAPSRYFVLVFRITKYDRQFRDGVKHVFDNILTETDQLRVFCNDKSLYFPGLGNKEETLATINKVLEAQSELARVRLTAYVRRIEKELALTRFKLLLNTREDKTLMVERFLKKYLRIWKDFEKRQLIPDIGKYYNFAIHLQEVKIEKWVINFYQMELFPQIALTGEIIRKIREFISELRMSNVPERKARARIFERLLADIDRELNVADKFPAEEIGKIFYKVNAPFHTIFMRSNTNLVSKDLVYKKISSDIENSLREITAATGGSLMTTNKLEKAMEAIGEKENLYYLLTYAPDNPDKVGKIKVKVGKKKYKVSYDDNMRADYIRAYFDRKSKQNKTPEVQIKKLDFKNKKLSIAIAGFLLRQAPQGKSGRTQIRIRIKNNRGQPIFDQSKALALNKDDITITIPFNNLKKGKYDIIVDVKDLLSGKSDTKFIQPMIR